MEALYWAYQETLRAEGYSKESRVGYSFGAGFAPDWGEKTVSCRPGDSTVLQPGMCLHLIAGAGDGYVFLTSEAIIITEGEPELLHDPRRRQLVVQSIPNLVSQSTPCHEEEEASFEVEVDHLCTTRERYCYARNGPGDSSALAVPVVPKAEPPSYPVPRVESVEDITGIWSMFQDAEGKPSVWEVVREDHQAADCVLMPRDLGP